ncbi:TRAP transporter fused permease subunit, partial [Acidobacteria bacterium AH-259-D05]|nr:TRAP transporter fused permease subunit [Acidobacteria bacterium AH-259-D05]
MRRQLKGPVGLLLSSTAVICSLYHLYTGFFGIPEAYLHRVIHVTFLIAISLMCYSASRGRPTEKLPWYDLLILIGWMISMGYIYYHYDWIIEHIGYTETFTVYEKVPAFAAIAIVLEACRRVIGWPLMVLTVIVVIYAFAGPYMPWLFYHLGYSASLVVDNQYFLTDGLFGLPTHISATYIFLFIVFGAFLEKSGFGQFTIDSSTALAGRLRGGPAKVAVLSSGLVGSVSGSSTANVVITGSFTIPMMKRSGFKDYVAAAVEAAASTGGLIMPPVMASVGFLMAQFTGIPYVEVMKLILLPAILYFLSIGIMVHIYAVREKLPIVAKEDLPSLKEILLSRGHLVLPLALLIYLIVSGRSPMFSVSYCIVAIVVVCFFRKETRMGLRDIWEALAQGSIQATLVAVAIITSAIMVGIFDLTGVAIKFSGLIVDITGGNLLFALFLIMIATIVLGTGLPLSSA